MKYPKLKYPRLCRLLTYIVVIGVWLLPIVIVFQFPLHDLVRVVVIFASLIGLLVYLFKNIMILMMMDMMLAMLSCHRTARKLYYLPKNRTTESIRRSILRYGAECDTAPIKPSPSALRYKFSNSMTVYSSGIERIVAAYEVDYLDRENYRDIFSSAKTNSKVLIGKKKARFLDSQQKKQPLHRVTVILILAHKVDPVLTEELYELVCKQCGDELENCIVPCVVDLEHHTCTFNCLRVPYVGFGYAVKNRGIRIIKNYVFGGYLPLTKDHTLPSIKDADPEMSLWDMWKELHHQFVGTTRKMKHQFDSLEEREIKIVDDELYLKWDQRGVCQSIQLDNDKKIAQVEPVTKWSYPKSQPIGKKVIQKITEHIRAYFSKQGFTVEFTLLD
jgi:hypothetical protein